MQVRETGAEKRRLSEHQVRGGGAQNVREWMWEEGAEKRRLSEHQVRGGGVQTAQTVREWMWEEGAQKRRLSRPQVRRGGAQTVRVPGMPESSSGQWQEVQGKTRGEGTVSHPRRWSSMCRGGVPEWRTSRNGLVCQTQGRHSMPVWIVLCRATRIRMLQLP